MQSNKGLSELILEQKYGRQLSWDRATTIVLAHPRERERERNDFYVALCGRGPVRARHLVPSIDGLMVVEAAPSLGRLFCSLSVAD